MSLNTDSMVVLKIRREVIGWIFPSALNQEEQFILTPSFENIPVEIMDISEMQERLSPLHVLVARQNFQIIYMCIERIKNWLEKEPNLINFLDPSLYTVDPNQGILLQVDEFVTRRILYTRLKELQQLAIASKK